jgi:hypothetical protein
MYCVSSTVKADYYRCFHVCEAKISLCVSRILAMKSCHSNVMSGAKGLGIFLFTTASRPVLGPTQPPIQLVRGALSLGVKRPGREADHSSPSSAEVKNAWSYTSTLPICLHGVVVCWSTGTNLPFTFTLSDFPYRSHTDVQTDEFLYEGRSVLIPQLLEVSTYKQELILFCVR